LNLIELVVVERGRKVIEKASRNDASLLEAEVVASARSRSADNHMNDEVQL
jgi:hypothetical protein